jgi:hypothetical protein
MAKYHGPAYLTDQDGEEHEVQANLTMYRPEL